VEVAASLRVSEVNGELAAGIPEDGGFETLAGFVLARLGHFPKRGESFAQDPFEYTVVEASDRRVIKVSLRPVREKVVA
jgi:CBS domain containing-hemolysin-like protein